MMKGYITFVLAILLSSAILAPLLFSPTHRANFWQAYESDDLYYALSSFKRLLSASGQQAADDAVRKMRENKVNDPSALRQAAVSAAALSWQADALGWNALSSKYKFGIVCPGADALPCANSISYLPLPSQTEGKTTVSIPVVVFAESKLTGRRISSALPEGYVLGDLG